MKQNDAELKERYDHFNALAFGNSLRSSKDVEIRFADPSEMGERRGQFTATYQDNVLGNVVAAYNFRILIRSDIEDVDSVLLHEMIHSELAQQLHTEEAHNKDENHHSPIFQQRASEVEKITGETIGMPDVVDRALRAGFDALIKAQQSQRA